MKNFLVIGLGEFGKSVAKTLYSNNATVLVIDAKENLIKQALNEGIIEEAIILDATDEIALKKVVRDDFDTAFVSVGDNIQASILITLQLKELGVKNIICKAVNHTQEKVLYKIGATQVIFPEESMGEKVAYSVLRPTIIDYFKFAEDYFIYEVKVPKTYVGKSLMELNLRHKYEINILAVKHFDGKMDVTPDPNIKLNKDDLLIILSRENVIDRVTKT
ncbi:MULTISPECIES: TrkA family potassium uptake protein [Capnocytophaga]|jgi:potassium uptake protein ktrA|uniref:potassium channel family protein n=1 Tax=Capnocytophaga TaxID=1016 RepID=UPI00020C7774|nr:MULTISPECIES: TrkA family potassium uptake protein [Capnocytophaga]KHE68643.1 putative Ktr system potassium uptake protein A [Capnocytophaga sp. oral taxon 329 str. F0087]QGS17495.1 TrkA family potassium uptake protein [Capnocytophaga sp. FDAARGOS_737]